MKSNEHSSMDKYFFRASAEDFKKIPGSPIAYWVSKAVYDAFVAGHPLSSIGKPVVGLQTGENARFVRVWQEVSKDRVGFGLSSRAKANQSGKKWFPYNKGGDFCRWYGNQDFVVNWESDGKKIQNFTDNNGNLRSRPQNMQHYFSQSISWSKISSSQPAFRLFPNGFIFDVAGTSIFPNEPETFFNLLGFCNSKVTTEILKALSPTLNFEVGHIGFLPILGNSKNVAAEKVKELVAFARLDWNSYEISWDFSFLPLLNPDYHQSTLKDTYQKLRTHWRDMTLEMQRLEEENNRIFIDAYSLQGELNPEVPLNEITLTCNPHYRYGGKRTEEELKALLQCDTIKELISYAIGCMLGRYSLDKPGLILASQGETVQDYLAQIPSPRYAPDEDAILPLTDQEWFADDVTNRFREFVKAVWGEEPLQENLNFVAESLSLNAIKPKRGESALDTIRRYLSSQFFNDHLRTYKKRPIYWLFSSGKQKAFECLVYLHRYHEGTLSRMRTEYVTPLMGKYIGHIDHLNHQLQQADTAEATRIKKEIATLEKQQLELRAFDDKLRHYADQRISLDLDDGVKVNYGKFGDLLAEVKAVTGDKG